MISINKWRLARLASASAFVATLVVTTVPAGALAATPPAPYFNGFENASDAVTPETSATEPMFNVTRVATGTNGINAASGSWYATAATDADAFSRLGGYSNTFPSGGYTTSVDAYLDMSQNATVGTDLRFDWSSAVSDTSATPGHRRDFIFSIGTDPTTPGQFVMSASNNAPGWPANPARDPLTVSTTGWYTFQHEFKNVGGVLSVDMTVLDAGSNVLHTWTLSDPSDIIGDTVGGNRYSWLVDNDFSTLALDNIARSGTPVCTSICYVDAANGNDAYGGATAGDAKKTIQAAVSQVSAGGTVQVAAGTYTENNAAITIDKNLTIQGPNAGISPNTGSRVGEAVLTSTASPSVFVISGGTSHVTFDGLKFDTSTAYMRNDWGDNITLSQNIFTATGGANDGMYFENPVLTVHDNLFKNIDTPNADTLQVGGHYPSSSHALSITDNVWDTITSSGALNLSNVTGTVSGNTFSHVQYYGILVAGASGNLDITNNAFDHITNPAPSTNATWGAGIRFYDASAATGPVNVTKNSFTNSYLGVSVRAGSNITSADIHVSRNAITGNSPQGILNAGTGTLNAECNWFGSASGPTDGLTPSGTGDAVSGAIDYISWLKSNDLNGTCDGTPQAISLLPSTWDFGNQNSATTSATNTFTVKNVGARVLTIQDVALHGTNPGLFGIDTNNCDDQVLAPNATCTILVDFRPTSTGSKTARLDVTSNDPNHHVQSSTLTGNGTTVVSTPDALISLKANKKYAGNGIYSSTVLSSQTKTRAVPKGSTRKLFVRLQNDGPASDTFNVDANFAGSASYTVHFFRGTTNITSAVLAGTYQVANLGAGGQVTIQMRITAASNTVAAATANVDVFVSSNSQPSQMDVVRGHVTRA